MRLISWFRRSSSAGGVWRRSVVVAWVLAVVGAGVGVTVVDQVARPVAAAAVAQVAVPPMGWASWNTFAAQ
ncbi:hypothetical protein JOL79_33590, partial [Microbispora sp. RL4-1S]